MASPFSWPVLVPYALRASAPVNLGVRPHRKHHGCPTADSGIRALLESDAFARHISARAPCTASRSPSLRPRQQGMASQPREEQTQLGQGAPCLGGATSLVRESNQIVVYSLQGLLCHPAISREGSLCSSMLERSWCRLRMFLYGRKPRFWTAGWTLVRGKRNLRCQVGRPALLGSASQGAGCGLTVDSTCKCNTRKTGHAS
jgi:hypothetical protein